MPTTISCTFTAISSGDGTFRIQALHEDGNKLALPSLVGFELKQGTSFDTAWQLAHDMQHHISGITVQEGLSVG
jgi:hypothetical protein